MDKQQLQRKHTA